MDTIDTIENCFICDKYLYSEDTIRIKQKAIDTLTRCSEIFQDNKHLFLRNKSQLVVHKKCRTDYHNAMRRLSDIDGPSSVPFLIRSYEDFNFKVSCLFCNESLKIGEKKYIIRSDKMKDKLMEIATQRMDKLGEKIIKRISDVESLVSVEACYHLNCFNHFVYIPKIEIVGIKKQLHESLLAVYNFIENHDDCQFTIDQLLSVMEYKPSEKTLINHLIGKYGDDITINTCLDEPTIISYSGSGALKLNDMWYMHQLDNQEDENIRVIKTAAELIRKQIKTTKYETENYPSAKTFFEAVGDDIPKYLKIFLDQVMLFDANKTDQKEMALFKHKYPKQEAEDKNEDEDGGGNVDVDISKPHQAIISSECYTKLIEKDENLIKDLEIRRDYMALSIIHAVRPKSFLSPLHLATGVYLNKKFCSKSIINMLAKLGICASYHGISLHVLSSTDKSKNTQIESDTIVEYIFDDEFHQPSALLCSPLCEDCKNNTCFSGEKSATLDDCNDATIKREKCLDASEDTDNMDKEKVAPNYKNKDDENKEPVEEVAPNYKNKNDDDEEPVEKRFKQDE